MIKLSFRDISSTKEKILEIIKFLGSWDAAVEAIEQYKSNQKTAESNNKILTWTLISLIALFTGLDIKRVLDNPKRSIEKLKSQIYGDSNKDMRVIFQKHILPQITPKMLINKHLKDGINKTN